MAEGWKYKKLQTGTWYKLEPYSWYDSVGGYYRMNNTVYKLTAKSDVILTASWAKNTTGFGIDFYTNKQCEGDEYYHLHYSNSPQKGTDRVILGKGVYWIRMYSTASEQSSVKIKMESEKAVQKANYCAAKAAKLNAGEMVKIAQTPFHSYDRWYKINLTKKKQMMF